MICSLRHFVPPNFVTVVLAAGFILACAGAPAAKPQATSTANAAVATGTPSATATSTPMAITGTFGLNSAAGAELTFGYVVPAGVDFDRQSKSTGMYHDPESKTGVVGFAEGGPGLGYGRGANGVPTAGGRGVVIADVTGAGYHQRAGIPFVSRTPADFFASLASVGGVKVGQLADAQLAGFAATAADVTASGGLCQCLEIGSHAVDFHGSSRVIAAQIGDRLILVQIWAGPSERETEALGSWLPLAMEFVNSLKLIEDDG